MEYFANGNLRDFIILNNHKSLINILSDNQIINFILQAIWALYYIQEEEGYFLGNIKPENILIDDKGYLAITDFGIARFKNKNNFKEKSGTPGYMAPEVMFSQNHSFAVDYYALGVIGYELIFGKRPYINIERKALKKEIFAKEAQIKRNQLPDKYSLECMDFINNMIKRKQTERLGYENISTIFRHPWLLDVDFKKLYLKKIESPLNLYINEGGNFDLKNVNYNKYLHLTNKTKIRYQKIIIHKKEYEHYFKDFYFYFNEFDFFDRKNTKIINKFINPHKIYNNNENITDNIYLDKEDDNNIKTINFTNNDFTSTGTIELHGDNILKSRNHANIKKQKIISDKEKEKVKDTDNSFDKEFKELMNEENDEDNNDYEDNNKTINIINNNKLKEKMRKCMNIKLS
jgi:serine/threonine protein kinase